MANKSGMSKKEELVLKQMVMVATGALRLIEAEIDPTQPRGHLYGLDNAKDMAASALAKIRELRDARLHD